MKLVASMVVRNEADRYLQECLAQLLTFCDEIRILDDGSTDEWNQQAVWWDGVRLDNDDRIKVSWQENTTFYAHEGRTRQKLLEWTMAGDPTHVLAIDADEFVADGQALRAALEEPSHTGVCKLSMCEVWRADAQALHLRTDGAWKPRPIGIAYAVPADHWSNRQTRRHWRMPDRALACGRTPTQITMQGNRTTTEAVTEILHFGWACEIDRAGRHQRYVVHDGGAHHASRHLDSIMWNDQQVQTVRMPWPASLPKDALLDRANRPF